MGVDEIQQTMQTNLWINFQWFDRRLSWDPADYNGITSIILPIEKIWAPDIFLHNSANGQYEASFKASSIIYHNGMVIWQPPALYVSACLMDMQWFPFDMQSCEMKFSSWTYEKKRVDIIPVHERADVASYITNGEWELVGAPLKRQITLYDCCPNDAWVDITLYVEIQRFKLFYIFNFLIPAVLVSIASLLTFILPTESGEKVTLSITVLLSLVFFLTMTASFLPATSISIPLLALHFGLMTLLCGFSLLTTVWVVAYHYRTPNRHYFSKGIKVWITIRLAGLLLTMKPQRDLTIRHNEGEETFNEMLSQETTVHLKEILGRVRQVTTNMQQKNEDGEVEEDWMYASRIVDRFCFIANTVLMAVSTATLYLLIPAPRPRLDHLNSVFEHEINVDAHEENLTSVEHATVLNLWSN